MVSQSFLIAFFCREVVGKVATLNELSKAGYAVLISEVEHD
jgi:hypothetical protein